MGKRGGSNTRRLAVIAFGLVALIGLLYSINRGHDGGQSANQGSPLPNKEDQASGPAHYSEGQARSNESGHTPDITRRSQGRGPAVRVVHDQTEQGVPWLQVELTRKDQVSEPIRGETDRDGLFVVTGSGMEFPTKVRVSDDSVGFSRTIDDISYDKDGVATIRVGIGPTYVFRLVGASPPPQELFARLVPEALQARGTIAWQQLRGGASPWVRFSASVNRLLAGNAERVSIRLDSAGGMATSQVLAPGTVGVFLDPIAVRFQSTGAITGTATREDGHPIVGARIDYRCSSNPNNTIGRSRGDHPVTDRLGQYGLQCLSPGEWEVKLETPGVYPISARVQVAPGSVTEYNFVINCGPGMELVGDVVCKRPRPGRVNPIVRLDSLADPIVSRCFVLDTNSPDIDGIIPTTDDNRVVWGAFGMKCVPPGRYALHIVCNSQGGQSPYFTEPSPLIVEVPSSRLTVELVQSTTAGELGFVVLDRRTQQPITEFDTVLYSEIQQTNVKYPDGVPVAIKHCKQDAGLSLVARQSRLRWMITARGYRTAFGNEGTVDWSAGRGQYRCRVEMESSGWGGLVLAYTLEEDGTWAVCPGTDVLVDGRVIGTTNGEGYLEVATPDAPRSLTVRRSGYSLGSQERGSPYGRPQGPYSDQSMFVYVLQPN